MGTSSGLGSGALGFLLHLGQLLSACLPSLLHGHWSECAEPHPEPGYCRHCLLLHQAWTCALAGDTPCFVLSGPGMLGSLLVFLLYVILALIFSTIINCNSGFQYTSATVRQTILCSVCFSLGMMSTLLLEDDSETWTPVYCPLL